jgi:hypothetical protein
MFVHKINPPFPISYIPSRSIIRPGRQAQRIRSKVQRQQHIAQERIPQHVMTSRARGNRADAERLGCVPLHVHGIDQKGLVLDHDIQTRCHGIAMHVVCGIIAGEKSWRDEHAVDC